MGRQSDIRRVTLIGLAANVLLCGVKLAAGVLGHSQAVVADAVHSASDVATDVGVLIGARYWSEPPDPEHPYGHGRVETFVALGLALGLAAVATGLVVSAIRALEVRHTTHPGWIAFAAAVLSLLVKEALYRWTVRRGAALKSAAMIANAWHHRSDAFSSIPAAAAVAIARLAPSWGFVDHVGSVVVSVFIIGAAWRIGAGAFQHLIDRGAPPGHLAELDRLARAVDGVRCVHGIRTRHLGSGWSVDLHVLVDAELPVRVGHDIATRVHDRLIASGPDVLDVVVHTEPAPASGRPGTDTHRITPDGT
jgi:cation diffusion facilitator family transporter